MEKKRPKGVTIFSWLIIVGSLLPFSQVIQKRTEYLPIIVYFTVVISVVSIIVAISLLKLKKWARIAIIAISILVAIKTLAIVPYSMNKIQSSLSERFEEHYKKNVKEKGRIIGQDVPTAEEARNLTLTFMKSFMAVVILISLGFNSGVIYYLTRPKVKEMFE